MSSVTPTTFPTECSTRTPTGTSIESTAILAPPFDLCLGGDTDVSSHCVRILGDSRGRADLVLDRPARHNAFNAAVIRALLEGLRRLRDWPGLRVLVLRSTGRHFSSGADLDWMREQGQSSHADNLRDAAELARLMQELDQFPAPVIARVQGSAFGGALGLIACCDVAIGTPASQFCLSEVKLGLAPAVISPYVNRAIGPRALRRFALTAELMSADTALHLGLLHHLTDEEQLDTAVETQVGALLRNGPLAMAATKCLLRTVDQHPLDEALRERTTRTIADLRVSAEGQEGLAAFLQKRKPAWQQPNPPQPTKPAGLQEKPQPQESAGQQEKTQRQESSPTQGAPT